MPVSETVAQELERLQDPARFRVGQVVFYYQMPHVRRGTVARLGSAGSRVLWVEIAGGNALANPMDLFADTADGMDELNARIERDRDDLDGTQNYVMDRAAAHRQGAPS